MGRRSQLEMSVRCWFASIILWLFEYADRVLRALGYDMCPLTAENILQGLSAEAREEAFHSDMTEPFTLFLEDAKKLGDLHLLHRMELVCYWKLGFTTRPTLQKIKETYPDVENIAVREPVFLVGMYRSGTTLLHRLLALDPRFYTPHLWELLSPLPTVRDNQLVERPGRDGGQDRRAARIKQLAIGHLLNPQLNAMHEVAADLPEECSVLLNQTPITPAALFEAMFALPTLRAWLYSRSDEHFCKAYDVYKQCIQAMAYKDLLGRRLLSKAPIHSFRLQAVLDVFPDAKIIYSHRRLTEAVPSCIKMRQSCHTPPTIDERYLSKKEFVENCLRLTSTMANNYISTARKYEDKAENPFLHYSYREMMADPIALVQRVYRHLDLDLTPEMEARMREYLTRRPQHHHGKAPYSMHDYGITTDSLKECFQPHIDYWLEKGYTMDDIL